MTEEEHDLALVKVSDPSQRQNYEKWIRAANMWLVERGPCFKIDSQTYDQIVARYLPPDSNVEPLVSLLSFIPAKFFIRLTKLTKLSFYRLIFCDCLSRS